MREGKTYYCPICGNEVVFAKDGGGTLICCGREMLPKEDEAAAKE